MTIERQNPQDVQMAAVDTYESTIREMDRYFGRVDDHDQIRTAIKDRYAVGIKEIADPSSNSTAVRETYVKSDLATAIDAGLIEALSMGLGQKVSAALATLFSEPGMRMDLVHETEDTDLASAEDFLDGQRIEGGMQSSLVECDKQSCSVGSSLVLLQYKSGHLDYTKISPADIYVIHGDTITDDGVERATDLASLEDASAVIINLGMDDIGSYRYIGIAGRCAGYKTGRWVEFSGYDGRQLPPDYDPDVIEFEINGKQANPLSWYAAQHPDDDVPEYPLIVIKGGICDTDALTPMTQSLYLDSIEFDVAASHTLSKSQENINGVTVIRKEAHDAIDALPRTVSPIMALQYGQIAEKLASDSGGSIDALEVLERLMMHCAAGYSVPDYMIVSRDHTLDASSGVALQIKARPLVKNREYRTELNKTSIAKLFDIERYLLEIHHDGDDSEVALLLECSQDWDPGQLKLPENKNELVTRLTMMLDKGIIDVLEYIRQYYMLPSDVDAEEMYTRMSERKDEFPALNKEEMDEQRNNRPLGLQRNRG